jgi:hypothetical protein
VSGIDDLEVELHRVTDRLNSMPISRAETVVNQCHAIAELIVDGTRVLTDELPSDAVVPIVGVSALGSQLAVVGADFVQAARTTGADVGPVLDALIDLRRSLP